MLELARFAVRRPVAMAVLAAATLLLGSSALDQLSVDLLPDLASPTIVVSLSSGDRPPEEMERSYGEAIEQVLFTVRGIRQIDQVARSGRLVATVDFTWETDMDLALVEVQKAISPLAADPEVDEVLVRRFDPRQAPILTLGLRAPSGQPGLSELRRLARRQIGPALEQTAGVAEVRVLGGRSPEVQVLIRPARLQAHRMTVGEVEARIRAANVDIAAGTLEEDSQVLLVRGLARFRSPEELAAVVVRHQRDASGRITPLRLGDLAEVRMGEEEIDHLVRVGGVEGVGVEIYKEAGANTVAVSRSVRAALDQIQSDLSGVEISVASDQAALVEASIDDVTDAALIGVLLAIGVLAAFLRSFGPTVIVAIAVPVSLGIAVFAMHLAGASLNLMTLGGLALGAGMLVDNAIIVVESIYRRLAEGDEPAEAAARGTARVAGAIAASTLTTCVVFLPVLFLKGLAARLVAGIALAVVVSLITSLGVAIFLIPALSTWFLGRKAPEQIKVGGPAFERLIDRLLARPLLVVLAAGLISAAALSMLRGLGTELLPPSDPRQLSLRLIGPPGQRVEATAEVVGGLEDLLLEAADGDAIVLSAVGSLPEEQRSISAEQSTEATARIHLRITGDGDRGAGSVVRRGRAAVEGIERHDVDWESGSSALATALGTTGPPIVVELSGASLDGLREAGQELRLALDARPELWNVRTSFEGGPPELRVRLRRPLADALGLDLDLLTATLEAGLDGRQAGVMALGDEEYPIALYLPSGPAIVEPHETLGKLRIDTPSGQAVSVAEVVEFEIAEGAREIFRRDQRRVAEVHAQIDDSADFPAATRAVREVLAELSLPPGVRARLVGEEAERSRTFRELGTAGALALVLVLMVLAGTFESLLHPITVLAAIPLSAIGIAAVLLPAAEPIGVMAMLGVLVLAGIAVNDAILLVDTARQLHDGGQPLREALVSAAGIRLRPILMTTATTVLALAPLAFGTGEAVALRQPLALAVIGGLLASTVTTLTVVPCLYLVVEKLRGRA